MSVEALETRALLSTFTVNSLGDTGTGTGLAGDLRYVITQVDKTPVNNAIKFSVTGRITLNSALPDLSNTSGLTDIEGPGAAKLTVARSGAAGTPEFGIFTVDTGVQAKLVGLTITGGSAFDGGGIDNAGTLSLSDSTVNNNSASDSNFPGGGGGIYNPGTMTITNSTIDNNSAAIFGGGIENSGTLTLTNSTIASNSAYVEGGGGLEGLEGSATLSNTIIASNSGGDIDGTVSSSSAYNLIGTGGSGGLVDGVVAVHRYSYGKIGAGDLA